MLDPKIREYLSRNGAKGGKAGKGTELRRKIMKAAIATRWAKARAAKAKQAANVEGEAK